MDNVDDGHEVSTLSHLKKELATVKDLREEVWLLAELRYVLNFLNVNGVQVPFLIDHYYDQFTILYKKYRGGNAVPLPRLFGIGERLGAVDYLIEKGVPEDEARATVSKLTRLRTN